MTVSLRAGVHGKVLRAGCGLHIFAVSLHSLDERDAEAGGQIRILAVGLMSAAPSRITENIHIRCPEGQALVDITVSAAALHVVLRTAFLCRHITDFLHHLRIKGGRHSDRLREHGRNTGACNAVQRLIPPVVGWNSETLNGRRIVFQLGCLLLQSHFPNQLLCKCSCCLSVHF